MRCTFSETKTTGVPQYLSDLIPQANHLYNICVAEDVIKLYSRTDLSSSLSFNTVLEWSKLDCNMQQSRTMPAVLYWLTIPKWIYNIYNPTGLTIPNRLRLGLSHLNQHKFNHNFRDCVNPLFPCNIEIESSFDVFFCTVIISQISRKLSLMNYCQLMKIL